MSNAATRAAIPVTATLAATIAELARAVASLFAVTTPAERARFIHRLSLAGILSLGVLVRFWGLGAVGLHGDEDTMAMAAMHILQDGRPMLPSGMFYPRGLSELYLMALSVRVFGESEWAFRLPSALCGVALVALAYLAGRRFLRPQWNLAFAATVALLPEFVVYSQTARMYVFMLAGIAACMVCIFAWERSNRLGWLAGAALALIVAIELHTLSVTCVLLFLLPGLLQGDVRKLAYGLGAACLVMLGYVAIDAWVNAQYPVPPPEYAADIAPPGWRGSRALSYSLAFELVLLAAAGVTACFAVHLGRMVPQRIASLCAAALLLAALGAQLMLFYHVAVLLIVVGVAVAYRYTGQALWRRIWMFTLSSAVVALIQVTVLAARPGSIVKLVGAMVGQPSVWPYVRVAEFSAGAALLAFMATGWGVWRIANRQRTHDYCLLAILGVWIPMFVLGFFVWDMPPRYTAASVLPLLLCAFAFVQHGVDWLSQTLWPARALRSWHAVAAFLAALLVIDPLGAAARINSGYTTHPDHKGAAEFMRGQQIAAPDLVLAEDVLQQTYYLGHVDYWLVSRKHARRFVRQIDGEIRDFYTGTPVIDSGARLERLLRRYPQRRIFVIGSGENQSDQRREMRGFGIFEMLASDRFEVLYVGRDGSTKVWRARPAPAAPSLNTKHSGRSADPAAAPLPPATRATAAGAE